MLHNAPHDWKPLPRIRLRSGEYLDSVVEETLTRVPNAIPAWILMASYLYYIKSFSILSDAYYDRLCKRLLESYETIVHRHKLLITISDLAAGSLYSLAEEEYPSITKEAALGRVEDHWGIRLD